VILEVSSDIPTFKTVRFRRGLNVLLADVGERTTERHTRNSAGKSSLIEIVHFLLGGEVSRKSLFHAEGFTGHSFSGVFVFGGRVARITRSAVHPKRIHVDEKRARKLRLFPTRDPYTGALYVPLDDWREFLGAEWFRLPRVRAGTDFEERYAPSFRALIGYFARRSADVAFAHVDRFSERQQPGDARVGLSCLLGLDLRIPHEMRDVRERSSSLKKLKRAVKTEDLGAIFPTAASLRPEIARLEERVARPPDQIRSFEALESYRDLASEAASLQGVMSDLSIATASAKDALNYLRKIAEEERPPEYASVESLYAAAGVELPQMALRSFADVARFQRSVLDNRQNYLREQMKQTEGDLADLESALRGRWSKVGNPPYAQRQGGIRGPVAAERTVERGFEPFGIAAREAQERELTRRPPGRHQARKRGVGTPTGSRPRRERREHQGGDRPGGSHHFRTIRRPPRESADRAARGRPAFQCLDWGGGNQGGIDQMKAFCFDLMLYRRTAARLGGWILDPCLPPLRRRGQEAGAPRAASGP